MKALGTVTNQTQAGVVEIDLHGMSVQEAKKALERLLCSCGDGIQEIQVIHGSNGGTALQNMVRTGLKHKRIARRHLTMNPGVTVLVLREVCGQTSQARKGKGGSRRDGKQES